MYSEVYFNCLFALRRLSLKIRKYSNSSRCWVGTDLLYLPKILPTWRHILAYEFKTLCFKLLDHGAKYYIIQYYNNPGSNSLLKVSTYQPVVRFTSSLFFYLHEANLGVIFGQHTESHSFWISRTQIPLEISSYPCIPNIPYTPGIESGPNPIL